MHAPCCPEVAGWDWVLARRVFSGAGVQRDGQKPDSRGPATSGWWEPKKMEAICREAGLFRDGESERWRE